MSATKLGWERLLDGYPWFAREGSFPLPPYGEFMPPPYLGRSPYGAIDILTPGDQDPLAWRITEIEEEYELRPGLEDVAQHVIDTLIRLNQGLSVPHLTGHQGLNLRNNPYWPPELAQAGTIAHERYVVLLPLALSRTEDDLGRVRWTLFGSSEQGPERAFWKGFHSASNHEWTERDACLFILRLLNQAYGQSIQAPEQLKQFGFRILPSSQYPTQALPEWTKRFVCDDSAAFEEIRYLLTFRPFSQLPDPVRTRYLSGQLNLLPCPHSLVFWGMPTYRQLERELPMAMQLPVLQLLERQSSSRSVRIPQSGWLHEPHPKLDPTTLQKGWVRNTYVRTNRRNHVRRYSDELALNPRVDKMSRVLFSTALEVMGLYDKPMAHNCQLWTKDFRLLLDGPNAAQEQVSKAEQAVIEGGLFGYRFIFPAMRVGVHEVYWQRPLVAFSTANGKTQVLHDAPPGYFTAYQSDAPDLAHPIELWPHLLRREIYLSALQSFEGKHDHYKHQTALNVLSILDNRQLVKHPLRRSFARHMLRIAKHETLDHWLKSLPARADKPREAKRVQKELQAALESSEPELPEPITYSQTATRSFEESWWNDIATLSHGQYINKDNADIVLDQATQAQLVHHQRDLEALGDYLIGRHRRAIAEADMEGQAICGELPFQWQTNFDYSAYDGWRINQEKRGYERNLLIVIPGKNRHEAVVMADHYDTAYMEDIFDPSRGGSGARLSAPGADDNGSASATLLQAAPIFLKLAREGRLERDVWLLHLTGEEYPGEGLGSRYFSQMLVEGRLQLHYDAESLLDLSSTRVVGLLVMDMIAHNRDNDRYIFQISPGKSADSLRLAEQAHLANMIWNAKAKEWNRRSDRRGKQRGQRSTDGQTMPAIARHPTLRGEVRTADDPQSSLYNTDGQFFSDVGVPVILFMENYDINRIGYHDTHDTLENIDLDYGSAVAAIAIETIARLASTLPTNGTESGQ
ncbi:MAG: M28 family metallopeptidase [Aggregatilineales bacterium]